MCGALLKVSFFVPGYLIFILRNAKGAAGIMYVLAERFLSNG